MDEFENDIYGGLFQDVIDEYNVTGGEGTQISGGDVIDEYNVTGGTGTQTSGGGSSGSSTTTTTSGDNILSRFLSGNATSGDKALATLGFGIAS